MKRSLCAITGALTLSFSLIAVAGEGDDDAPPSDAPFARSQIRLGRDSFQGRAEASTDGWSSSKVWGRPDGFGVARASVRDPNGNYALSTSSASRGFRGDTNSALSISRVDGRLTIGRTYASPEGVETSTWTAGMPARDSTSGILSSARSRFR